MKRGATGEVRGRVYLFILDYVQRYNGLFPTELEIGEGVGIHKGGVTRHLAKLEEEGKLLSFRPPHRQRKCYTVTPINGCPICGYQHEQ